ncbi:hypothetical protein VTO42DRAFT_7630 [Malbranchea cinnamomea]
MPFKSLICSLAASAALVPHAAGFPELLWKRQVTYADGIEVPASPPVVTATSAFHGPFTGRPLVTGALTATGGILGTAISPLPPSPEATTYPSDGQLHDPQPAPFVPAGGLGTNGTIPVYRVQSDYDYQSVALALYMEWLHHDLFQTGLSRFSESDFVDAGLDSNIRELFQWMVEQSLGHITMLTNILGPSAPVQCSYNYPWRTLREWIDFCQKITRVTEATLYGFIPHLDSRPVASLLLESVAISARQQLVFRQVEGLPPMPVWFKAGIPESWGWSLVAPFISSCPDHRLVWQNFPPLVVVNQPDPYVIGSGAAGSNFTGLGGGLGSSNLTGISPSQLCPNATAGGAANGTVGGNASECAPSIASNRTALTSPGRQVRLVWETAANASLVGPNNSYVPHGATGRPGFVAWVSQLNVTYTPLTDVTQFGGGGGAGGNATGGGGAGGSNLTAGAGIGGITSGFMGTTTQPDLATYRGDPMVNGTVFIAITDADFYLTPFNLSLINDHVVAGPAVYQAG